MQQALSGDLLHADMRPGWVRPAPPDNYEKLVLCEYGFASELDWYNEPFDYFYSQDQGVALALEFPWRPGFNPTKADWAVLGIEVIDFRLAFQ